MLLSWNKELLLFFNKLSWSPPRKLMKTTLDGKKAGLQDARSMKVENEERRKKESKMLDGVSPICFWCPPLIIRKFHMIFWKIVVVVNYIQKNLCFMKNCNKYGWLFYYKFQNKDCFLCKLLLRGCPLDVLCPQQIKLFQVVSTSDFHEYWWNDLENIFLVLVAFWGASEARTQSRP